MPPNFSVFFAYLLGGSEALRKTIDVLRSNNRKFDKAVNRELYSTFLQSNNLGMADQTVSEELSTILLNVKQGLSDAAEGSGAQVHGLATVAEALQADRAIALACLRDELSKATERAASLQMRLASASGEVEKLRADLEKAEIWSRTDPLTGLANHRALEPYVRSAQIKAMEQGGALGTFLVDIDYFKAFNDKYGHQLGDQVLRVLAKCVQEGVREGDLAARYGGEELMCVLPDAALEACLSAQAKRRDRIFLDYLRNGRGTTAIGTYSPRAREGFPIAAPVTWKRIGAGAGRNRQRFARLSIPSLARSKSSPSLSRNRRRHGSSQSSTPTSNTATSPLKACCGPALSRGSAKERGVPDGVFSTREWSTGMPDRVTQAVKEAQAILARYVEPGPRDCQSTINDLLAVLEDERLVQAMEEQDERQCRQSGSARP